MPNEDPRTLANIARATLGQGLGMGWGDEAEAWLRSKLNDENYEDALKKIKTEYAKFAEESPYAAPALELAGGILPAAGMTLLAPFSGGATAPAAASAAARALSNPLVRSALSGLTSGAISGAGAAEPESRTMGAVTGGILGGGLGATVPIVGRTAKEIYDYGKGMISKSPELVDRLAAAKLSKAAKDVGVSPEELYSKYLSEELSGRPGMLAFQIPKLSETVAQRAGAAPEIMEREISKAVEGGERALTRRAPAESAFDFYLPVESGGRAPVDELIQRALESPNYRSQRDRIFDLTKLISNKKFYTEQKDLMAKLRAKAGPAYEEAYAIGEITDPKILTKLEKDPDFAAAFKEAQAIARREASAAEFRGEDPSKYMLRPIYETIVEEGKEPVQKLSAVPTLRELDYIKRGMDAKIQSLYKDNPAQAKALKELRNDYRDYLDKITEVDGVSPYKKARDIYAGDLEIIDALEDGQKNFQRWTKEELADKFSKMTESEKRAFKTGAVQGMYDSIMKPSRSENFAAKFLSPDMKDRIRILAPSNAQADLILAAMKRESDLFGMTSKILRGSATAQRTQMQKSFEERPPFALQVAESLTGGLLPTLGRKAMEIASNASMSDEVAERVAKLLTSSDPHEVASAVKLIEQYPAKARAVSQGLSRKEMIAAGAGATAMAPPPEATNEEPEMAQDLYSAAGLKGEKEPEKTKGPSLWDAAGVKNFEEKE